MKAWPFLGLLLAWLTLPLLPAQAQNPAAGEDAEIERRKILKAADQVDQVQAQMEKVQTKVDALEKFLEELKAQSQTLKETMANSSAKASQDRQAILEEVSKILAERKDRDKPAPTAESTSPANREGYEHLVAKGDTLSSIAAAYNQEHKLKLTPESIRKANHLAKDAPLKVGQKLFIPSS